MFSWQEVMALIASTQLLVLALDSALNYKKNQIASFFAALCLSITGHLLPPVAHEKVPSAFFYGLLLLSLTPAPAFWLLSLAIFKDGFQLKARHLFIAGITVASCFIYLLYQKSFMQATLPWQKAIASLFPQLPLLSFGVAALWEAIRGRSNDLVEWRLKLRYILVLSIGILIILVAVFEIALKGHEPPQVLQILKLSIIIILVSMAQIWRFPLREDFAQDARVNPVLLFEHSNAEQSNNKQSVPDPTYAASSDLVALKKAMNEDKIFCQEGLTIGKLARTVHMQEYLLRKLINQGLGYRNFNQFLNQHRIAEARRILASHPDANYPIIRIAYDLGYQSLALFNLAFRNICGQTPSAYRKKMLTEGDAS